jgi:putative sterol carrier protein
LGLPLNFLCRDSRPEEPKVVVRVGDLQDGCDVIADGGVIEVLPVSADRTPDAIVEGPPQELVAVFTGQLSPDAAVSAGITVEGAMSALRRILPSVSSEMRAR